MSDAVTTEPRAVPRRRERWLTVAVGCVLIAGVTVWLRYRAVGITSLWFDDAWVGVGAHFPAIGDTIRSGLTSPGFSLLYRGWAGVFGAGATAAQILPLILAVATPVVVFLVAIERGLPMYSALVAGGLLATAPAHIENSARLKQYSAEALIATVVLWAAWRVLDRPAAAGRWAALAALAIVGGLVSGVGALVGGSAFAVCLLGAVLAKPRRLRAAIIATLAYAVVVGTWMVVAVRPNVHGKLTDYWRGYFLDGDGFAGGIWPRLERLAHGFQDVPATLVVLVLAVGAGIVLVRRPLVGLLLVTPMVVAIVLAALTILPIGTERTDVYLFPSFALLVVIATTELVAMVPAQGRWTVVTAVAVGLVVIVIVAPPAGEDTYFREELTPLVRLTERRRAPGDEILVYPSAGYAYGIATRYPIERRSESLAATDWVVDVRGPDITVLEPHRRDPEQWAGPLDRITANTPRIWLLGSHIFRDFNVLQKMLKDRGYGVAEFRHRHGAALVVFAKLANAPAPPS